MFCQLRNKRTHCQQVEGHPIEDLMYVHTQETDCQKYFFPNISKKYLPIGWKNIGVEALWGPDMIMIDYMELDRHQAYSCLRGQSLGLWFFRRGKGCL